MQMEHEKCLEIVFHSNAQIEPTLIDYGCVKNYKRKGRYVTKLCTTFNIIDDESHRINHYIRWRDIYQSLR